MKKWFINGGLVLAGFFLMSSGINSCGSSPGGPTPDPTSTPRVSFPELLLSTKERKFVSPDGKEVDLKGFSSCCFSEDPEPSPDWSLISPEYIDYLLPKYGGEGKLLIHIRVGPWIPQSDFPPSLIENGSPYLTIGGKADLFNWNPKFWDRLKFLLSYGGQKGVRFEVDAIDIWGCKQPPEWHERNLKGYHPWLPGNNIQGIDAYTNCGNVEILPGSVYDTFLRKLFTEVGAFGNFIVQDGNEALLARGYTPAWTASIGNILRDVEAINAFPRHLFGTNAWVSAGLPQVDYVTIHTKSPATLEMCNTNIKPCRNTEYNPSPAFTASQVRFLYCDAKRKGIYWDFWRGGMSLSEALKAWTLMGESCEGVVTGCTDIPDGEEGVDVDKVVPKPPSLYTPQVNAILKEMSPSGVDTIFHFPQPLQVAQQQFAELFRKRNSSLCAGIQKDAHGDVDQVTVGTREVGQNYHPFNCEVKSCPEEDPDCGCNEVNSNPAPGSVRDTWRRK